MITARWPKAGAAGPNRLERLAGRHVNDPDTRWLQPWTAALMRSRRFCLAAVNTTWQTELASVPGQLQTSSAKPGHGSGTRQGVGWRPQQGGPAQQYLAGTPS